MGMREEMGPGMRDVGGLEGDGAEVGMCWDVEMEHTWWAYGRVGRGGFSRAESSVLHGMSHAMGLGGLCRSGQLQ